MSTLTEDEIEDMSRWDAIDRADMVAWEREQQQIPNVTLNGGAVFTDEFEDTV